MEVCGVHRNSSLLALRERKRWLLFPFEHQRQTTCRASQHIALALLYLKSRSMILRMCYDMNLVWFSGTKNKVLRYKGVPCQCRVAGFVVMHHIPGTVSGCCYVFENSGIMQLVCIVLYLGLVYGFSLLSSSCSSPCFRDMQQGFSKLFRWGKCHVSAWIMLYVYVT